MEASALKLLSNKELTLEELAGRYPEEWARVQKEVCIILASREAKKISEYALKTKSHAELWQNRIRKSGKNPKVIKSAVPHLIRTRLSHFALNEYIDAVAKKSKKKPLSKKRGARALGFSYSSLIYKKYLTHERLQHPPIDLKRHAFWWRFVRHKGTLLGGAYRAGVYCIYTKKLIEGLCSLLGQKNTLEIAAGDGALTSYLLKGGCTVRATDDHSWHNKIQYAEHVEKLAALAALKKYRPEVVISCFPPAPNSFEKHVFTCPSVNLYIVIGSRHDYASGDYEAYKSQKSFSWEASLPLSNLIFPPEIDPCLYLFKRLEK